MIDKRAVTGRFLSCYECIRYTDLARVLRVHQTSISKWAKFGNVPWNKLKYLSDTKAISWDWLLDGIEPKKSIKLPIEIEESYPEFDDAAINRRFLELFEGMTQSEIARALEISPQAVHEWIRTERRVSWNYLDFAVTHFGVRWDWIIDGLGPKYRNSPS